MFLCENQYLQTSSGCCWDTVPLQKVTAIQRLNAPYHHRGTDGSTCQFCTFCSHWIPESPVQLWFYIGELFCASYNVLSLPLVFKGKYSLSIVKQVDSALLSSSWLTTSQQSIIFIRKQLNRMKPFCRSVSVMGRRRICSSLKENVLIFYLGTLLHFDSL